MSHFGFWIPDFGLEATRGRCRRRRPIQNPKSKIRNAFTLTELLIVIGLIVLIATLAIPAFSLITGGRSIDAAQNQVSAVLGRARADAIGLQSPRGAVFYQDSGTGRVGVAEVYYDPNPEISRNNPNRLEMVPDREDLLLPVGVGCQTLVSNANNPNNQYALLGVVMFDGQGRVMTRPWVIAKGNDLGDRIGDPLPTQPQLTTIGFMLYDREPYDVAVSQNKGPEWVRDNAIPFLVNRYNGTLMRGE